MRRMVAGGFAAAMVLAAGAAQAQVVPPVVVPGPEFYIGGGALYGIGIGRDVSSFGRFDPQGFGGPGFFAFAGTRVPFRGMFFGVEGEYDFTRRSHGRVLDHPGFQQFFTTITPTGQFGSSSATVGAFTESYNVSLSDRIGLFGTAFFPVGGVELFAKAGVTYTSLSENYSAVYNTPIAVSTGPITCSFAPGRPLICSGGAPVFTTVEGSSAGIKQNLFAPAIGGGIQIPFGNVFARIEGQVDLLNFGEGEIQVPFNTTTGGVTTRGITIVSSRPIFSNSDARVMLSVGYKW